MKRSYALLALLIGSASQYAGCAPATAACDELRELLQADDKPDHPRLTVLKDQCALEMADSASAQLRRRIAAVDLSEELARAHRARLDERAALMKATAGIVKDFDEAGVREKALFPDSYFVGRVEYLAALETRRTQVAQHGFVHYLSPLAAGAYRFQPAADAYYSAEADALRDAFQKKIDGYAQQSNAKVAGIDTKLQQVFTKEKHILEQARSLVTYAVAAHSNDDLLSSVETTLLESTADAAWDTFLGKSRVRQMLSNAALLSNSGRLASAKENLRVAELLVSRFTDGIPKTLRANIQAARAQTLTSEIGRLRKLMDGMTGADASTRLEKYVGYKNGQLAPLKAACSTRYPASAGRLQRLDQYVAGLAVGGPPHSLSALDVFDYTAVADRLDIAVALCTGQSR